MFIDRHDDLTLFTYQLLEDGVVQGDLAQLGQILRRRIMFRRIKSARIAEMGIV